MKKIIGDFGFIMVFVSAVLVIFWDILILKGAFLRGDYLQQFFPWYNFYSLSLRQLSLPFWMPDVQAGFPVFAEGQIGALYPFNVLFYTVLPFKSAYNYSFLFHFILSGILLYTYSRSIQTNRLGSLAAALIFCFGSVNAGCFVNISALKALTWFSLVLLLFERYLQNKKIAYILIIGLICGMQLLAGSFQMTIYAFLFYAVYFAYRCFQEKAGVVSIVKNTLILFSIAFIVALPQLNATFELSRLSNRAASSLEFALWNSFSPGAFFGIVFPYLGSVFSRGDVIYVSIVGLFFAVLGAAGKNKGPHVKALILLLVVSILCALGKYNPLYVLVVKAASLYSFRSPSRFIFFASFSLSLLAGRGVSYFFEVDREVPKSVYRVFYYLVGFFAACFVLLKVVLMVWGERILAFGKEFVTAHIFGASFHRFSLEAYLSKTERMYSMLIDAVSLKNIFNLGSIVCIVLGIALLLRAKSKNTKIFVTYLALVLICFDLYFFSFLFKGLRSDIAAFEYIKPQEQAILKALTDDKELFRIMPFGGIDEVPLWLKPSMNAYFGLESVSFYSPLAHRDYYEKTKALGIVDDSLGSIPPSEGALEKERGLLEALNVKYILSKSDLNEFFLEKVMDQNNLRMYKFKNYKERFFFKEGLFKGGSMIKVLSHRAGYAKVRAMNPGEDSLVFSQKHYPGWEVFVDGKKAEIIPYMDILQSVRLPAGPHEVIFKFNVRFFSVLCALQLFVVFAVFTVSFFSLRRGKLEGAGSCVRPG